MAISEPPLDSTSLKRCITELAAVAKAMRAPVSTLPEAVQRLGSMADVLDAVQHVADLHVQQLDLLTISLGAAMLMRDAAQAERRAAIKELVDVSKKLDELVQHLEANRLTLVQSG